MLPDEGERRLRRLVVALDRRRFPAPDVVAVVELDLDDVGPVGRLAGDHERLGEAKADDGGLDEHALELTSTR